MSLSVLNQPSGPRVATVNPAKVCMQSKPDSTRRFTRTAGLNERRVGEKLFVLDDKTQLHTLDNASAVFLWERIPESDQEAITVDTLVNLLHETFEIGPAVAHEDCINFVEQLVALSLVQEI